jgi:glyoxylase-like metal-dependent hydrolase (beta-lactamase superfamily II)
MEVLLVRAANPSPYTLDGTNTWIVGRDPAWVVDPGPALDAHLDAVAAAVARRGGAGGIALTHDHHDHAEGLDALRTRLGDPPVGAWPALGDGDRFGPFTALHVPGHAPDHLVLVAGRGGFTGDAVLGAGSVFIAPGGGSLGAYLDGLRRLRALELERLYPGHGPIVEDAAAKLDEYVEHRLERERRIVAALDAGARTEDELLAHAWDAIPEGLRLPATWTLQAHLEKLREERRLPEGAAPWRSAPGGSGDQANSGQT